MARSGGRRLTGLIDAPAALLPSSTQTQIHFLAVACCWYLAAACLLLLLHGMASHASRASQQAPAAAPCPCMAGPMAGPNGPAVPRTHARPTTHDAGRSSRPPRGAGRALVIAGQYPPQVSDTWHLLDTWHLVFAPRCALALPPLTAAAAAPVRACAPPSLPQGAR
jgi:hypothetical protein